MAVIVLQLPLLYGPRSWALEDDSEDDKAGSEGASRGLGDAESELPHGEDTVRVTEVAEALALSPTLPPRWLHVVTLIILMAAAVVRFSLPSLLYLMCFCTLCVTGRKQLVLIQRCARYIAMFFLAAQAIFQIVLGAQAPYASKMSTEAALVAHQLGL